MAEVIKMPKLSDTMTEGVVAEWHKKVGDTVNEGEILAEIETDKATMEFESFYDGTLLYIGVDKGQAAPVDSVLAIIGEKGEDFKKILADAQVNAPVIEKNQAPTKTPEISEKIEIKQQNVVVSPRKQEVKIAVPKPVLTPSNGKVKASPLAKRLAEEKGLDISRIPGSGEGGRIIKRDIDNYQGAGFGNRTPFVGTESYTEEPVSQMRKVIAKRLGESKFSAPHFYLTMAINMDNAISSRKAINAQGGNKISFNDLVVKACAMALRKHPKVNSSWLGDKIRYNQHIHIGVAVAVDEGLLVPVVRFADTKSFEQINAEVKDFAQRARDKKLQPEDWEGNTFTISNLGMFGIEEFTAIINPPDACILAVGGIQQVPVVKNGEIVPGNIMKVTLSCDHRVVDGVVGSAFLNTLKTMLENPVTMFI